MQNSRALIISRYKENVDWIQNIYNFVEKIFIYNKNNENDIKNLQDKKISVINLPNIGRESNSYLYHIVNNYEDLQNHNIFLQGNPYDHCKNLDYTLNEISKYSDDNIFLPLNKVVVENNKSKYRKTHPHTNGLPIEYFMNILFNIKTDPLETILVNYGAQFIVSKNIIQKRSRSFYDFLLKLNSRKNSTLEPYIFERLWLYIFDPRIPLCDDSLFWSNK
jgi:hypothetical protein